MQGAKHGAFFHNLLHALIHQHGIAHGFAAVQHAVADGVNFALVLDNALVAVGQQGDDQFHGFDMGGEEGLANKLFFLVRIGDDFMGEASAFLADALGKTGAEHAARVHFQQLILAGRGTRVNHQNFHDSSFP